MSLKTLVGSGIQKKFGSGSGMNHSGTATLYFTKINVNVYYKKFVPFSF